MIVMSIRISACAFGLIAGNYIFQAFNMHDWALAADRSFFQTMALLAMWLSLVLIRAER